MKKRSVHSQRGSSLAELCAALVVVFPLFVLVLYVTLEACHAYLIKNGLNEATRQAARDLAKAYDQNVLITDSRALQDSEVLSKISIPGILNSTAQFTVQFNETATPPNVAVSAVYEGGKYGLSAFPTVNPLHLSNPFKIACQSVYRLE
ncbi:MAG TPA: TadE/TadG family type IV pilus assembly protein [Candidatus Obscuribacterales bacterium]